MHEPIIFVAEDDPDDQFLLTTVFEEIGVDIELRFFEHGGKLLAAMASESVMPNLILLDLNLPQVDGKESLSSLKQNSKWRNVPVVVYTTSKSESDVNEVYAMGANSYIVKPARYDELIETMRTLVNYWFSTVRLSAPV